MNWVEVTKGYKNLKQDLEHDGNLVVEIDPGTYISDGDVKKSVFDELKSRLINWPTVNIVPVGYDGNTGLGYHRLGEEILRQNPKPTHIFVPYGGGEIGLGVYNSVRARLSNNGPTVVFVELKDKHEIEGKNLTDNKTRTKYTAYGDLIRQLEKQGKIIDQFDCVIAGIFQANGINKLISKNSKHFENIPNLNVIAY